MSWLAFSSSLAAEAVAFGAAALAGGAATGVAFAFCAFLALETTEAIISY